MENLTTIKLTVDSEKGVALVRFDRPAKRNAFSQVMIGELVSTLAHLDALETIRAVVVTGGPEGPFCAGMDLNELVQISTAAAHQRAFLKDLTDAFANFSKPIIAAVVGFALGGGCEIALACDMIYAAEDASFGLPEIKIGTIPGAGGTQRLARALGKHKAMEFVLTGDSASGAEFERLGVVNKVFPRQEVVPAAMKLAERIAVMSGPVTKTAKQAVLTVENSHLDAGMTMEKSLYYSTFSLGDFNEGMTAFLQKRRPDFKHT
ncbi:enoyl-CoA hydratase/isomerase [Colletotrichum abscissum]|uniref:Enoyl-CoA hydratase/isomerase n=1 Tax=Colletotrichum abscissum TaxID=1671311 RepID=A0A9P9XTM5_9PEZI|nr:enoyl-CoA hydratase/isomerase [Colletotrichum abscissum]KAI3559546.1 enoyl-CoA hydratase/isomerase [Colletotrichum abscissum]KAK1503526.1 enoyl-CoA hydratase/isomerase [Colletotrichum abscissum]